MYLITGSTSKLPQHAQQIHKINKENTLFKIVSKINIFHLWQPWSTIDVWVMSLLQLENYRMAVWHVLTSQVAWHMRNVYYKIHWMSFNPKETHLNHLYLFLSRLSVQIHRNDNLKFHQNITMKLTQNQTLKFHPL